MTGRRTGYVNGHMDGELADRQMERQTAPVWETHVAQGPTPSPAVNLSQTKSSSCHPPSQPDTAP